MEISTENLSALESSNRQQSLQIALLKKSMSMEESVAGQLLDTIPQIMIDHSAPRGQQVRIKV